jgi:hypothetical protein
MSAFNSGINCFSASGEQDIKFIQKEATGRCKELGLP